MKKWLLFIPALGLALRLGAASFPQDLSDLRPDPAARFGALPNGLRYVVLANPEPRNRASLRLLVLSGSLEEGDDQRGLAHFLEHMAFNGSRHFPPGTLVAYFQRLGMSFGGDTNAYTSFDHTAFKIELPDVRPATVAEGLKVFADMAGSLLLRPDMIEKERPIILSEERTRDSVGYREFVASFAFLLPDSLLPRRMPIGLISVIQQAQRDRFVDFYDTWYRPERMVLVAVGAIDPDAVIRQITRAFGSVAARAPARSDPDLGHVTAALGLRTAYHPEPDGPDTAVAIDAMAPYAYRPDTAQLRLQHLRRDLAVAMLNRRLEILAKKEGAAFINATVGVEENFNFVHDAEIELKCLPRQWPAALAVGEQELRRALQYGFAPAELNEAKANFGNDLDQAAAAASTRHSDEIADEIVQHMVEKSVFTSPSQDLALDRPALAGITPEECAQALRFAFALPGRYVMVEGNAAIAGDAPAAIARAYQAAHAVAVDPPHNLAAARFAYTDFGPAGKTASRRHIEDLDITLATLANGVRIDIKKTHFEANQIRLRLRFGAGRLVEPRDQPGLDFFSDLTFVAGGLGRQSADQLQTLLAGRTLSMDFATRDDAFEFNAATNRADLLLQLQLLTAYLTDPGYRAEAARTARKTIDQYYTEFDHVVDGPFETVVPRFLADGDPRFGLPDRPIALARNLGEEKAWLGPQLASGPIEIGLAGDLDVESTLDALARTLGTLPARQPKPPYRAERLVKFPPPPPIPIRYAVPSQTPKAAVAVYWPTADDRDVHRTRRLALLAEVFADRLRLRLREKLGAAYDPEAASEPSDTFTDYGVLAAKVIVAPGRVEEVARTILEMGATLREWGVSADELDRAKRPLLTALRQSARTNQYWIGAVLANCQEHPERLDWARSRESDVVAVRKIDLDNLAKTYLASSRAFQIIVTPK